MTTSSQTPDNHQSDSNQVDTKANPPPKPIKSYPCPNCQALTPWQGNVSKPFCSERCKLIDLGAWANEDYKVPALDSPFSDEL